MAADNVNHKFHSPWDKGPDNGEKSREQSPSSRFWSDFKNDNTGKMRSDFSASDSRMLEDESKLGRLNLTSSENLNPQRNEKSFPSLDNHVTPRLSDGADNLTGKVFDRFKASDTNKPFVDITPDQASKLLDTPQGKVLPPLAERFEDNALKQLGPEAKPTIFVSNDAHDKALPAGAASYRSIEDAVKHAKSGDVIQVLPGTYKGQVNLSGEAQSNITIQTDRQNPAVISGGGFRIGSNAHDISIRNFEVKNFSGLDSGIRVDGSNIHDITIAGNNVHDAQGSEGIAVYGRPGEPVTRVSIIGNRVHDLTLGELESIPINGNVDGFKVIGNSGYHLNNLFIDVIGGEGNGGNKDQARNGVIANNFADGITTRHNNSYGDYSSAAIYSDGGKGLDIFGNYVRNSDFGVEIGSEHEGLNSSDIKVHDNIIENSVTWLKLGYKGGVDHTTVSNNLVLNNKLGDVEREGPVSKSTVKVDGNISASDRHHVTKIPWTEP